MEFKINFIFIVNLLLLLFILFAFVISIKDEIEKIKGKEKTEDNNVNIAFKIESYLAYNSDEDVFTKKEILELIEEIIKEK